MKAENIINGLKKALLKCNAITPDNAEAIESLLNNQVKNDIEKYAQQQVKNLSLGGVSEMLVKFDYLQQSSDYIDEKHKNKDKKFQIARMEAFQDGFEAALKSVLNSR